MNESNFLKMIVIKYFRTHWVNQITEVFTSIIGHIHPDSVPIPLWFEAQSLKMNEL